MGDHPTEETQFVVDEVSNVIKEAIETTIGGNSYTVGNIEKYLLVREITELCCLSARQGEPVDQWDDGVLPGQPHQAAEAIQVHRDLRDHAGK